MIEKTIKLLEWYYKSGVTDIISKFPRSYLKNDSNTSLLSFGSPTKNISSSNIVKDNLSSQVINKQKISRLPSNKGESNNLSSRELADNCSTISELRKAVQNFEGCALKKTAANTVFSDGNQDSEIMLVGEAPGRHEDEKAIPFCGDSGKLLDKILKTINLVRQENIYITNVVFWRPPANRKPTDEELNICLPFVEKHISLMSPKLIVIAGGIALYSLFGIPAAISKYRQKILQYTNQYLSKQIPVIIIFHPSYLLRQPMQKKLAWQDMIFIKKFLDNHR